MYISFWFLKGQITEADFLSFYGKQAKNYQKQLKRGIYIESQFHSIQSTAVWPWAWAEQHGGRSKCWRRVAVSIVDRKKTGRSIYNAQRHTMIEHILPTRLHLLMFPKLAKIKSPSGNQAIST